MLPLSAVLLATLTAILLFEVAPLADKPSAVNTHRILSNYKGVVVAFVTMGKQRRLVSDMITPCASHLAFHGTL